MPVTRPNRRARRDPDGWHSHSARAQITLDSSVLLLALFRAFIHFEGFWACLVLVVIDTIDKARRTLLQSLAIVRKRTKEEREREKKKKKKKKKKTFPLDFYTIFVSKRSRILPADRGGDLCRAARARELAHASGVRASPPGCLVRTATRHGTTAARMEETLPVRRWARARVAQVPGALVASFRETRSRVAESRITWRTSHKCLCAVTHNQCQFHPTSLQLNRVVPQLYLSLLSQPEALPISRRQRIGVRSLQGLRKSNRHGRNRRRQRWRPPINRRLRWRGTNRIPCHYQQVERKRTSVSQRMQMRCSWRRRSWADLRMIQRSSGRPTGPMWGFVLFPSLFQLRLQLFRGEMHMVGKSFCSKSRVLTSRLYNGDQTSSLFRWAPQAKSLSRSQRAWSKLLPKAVHWSQCRSGPLCSCLACCSSSLRDSPPIANERTAYSDGFFCGRREILVSFSSKGG